MCVTELLPGRVPGSTVDRPQAGSALVDRLPTLPYARERLPSERDSSLRDARVCADLLTREKTSDVDFGR